MNYSVMSSAPAPRQECTLRVLCVLSGLGLSADGVVLFLIKSTETNLQLLLQFYYMWVIFSLFGLTMILIELNLRIVKKYWRFLVERFGKGLFYVL